MADGDIDKKTVKFEAGKYYLITKENFLLKAADKPEELANLNDVINTDIVLVALPAAKFIKAKEDKKKKTDSLAIDFDKKELTIVGASCILAKTQYDGDSVYDLDTGELEDWENIVEDMYKTCPNSTTIIGNPPVKGLIQ